MTEQDPQDSHAHADEAPGGVTPIERGEKSVVERRQDAVPLSAGAVRNGGSFNGGTTPDETEDDPDEPRNPLDARTHFGGDGAQYVAPDEPRRSSHIHGATDGDDGFDAAAHGTPQTEAD